MMLKTKTGFVSIKATDAGICSIRFVHQVHLVHKAQNSCVKSRRFLRHCQQQLKEYFAGTRKKFTVPLLVEGTLFQKQVWRELQKIPFGQTVSYGEIARRIGKPKAARAVGGACNKNKIPIMIPCHRVVGASGKLVGFAGGVGLKKKLLALEGHGLLPL